MSWGRMEADKNGGGGVAAVRLLSPFSRTTAAAAGPSGGKFGRCRSIWRQVLAAAGPLQGRYTHPPFNGAAAVEYALCYLQVLPFLF